MRAEVTHCTCGGSCSTGSRCCRSGGGSCGCLRALRGSGQYDLGDLGGGFHIPKCSERIQKCQDRLLLEYPWVYGYDFRKTTIVDQGIIDYILYYIILYYIILNYIILYYIILYIYISQPSCEKVTRMFFKTVVCWSCHPMQSTGDVQLWWISFLEPV